MLQPTPAFHLQSSRGEENISTLAKQDLKSKEEYFRSYCVIEMTKFRPPPWRTFARQTNMADQDQYLYTS